MRTRCYLFILVVYFISRPICTSGWQTSPSQYHIQTDEGPERYFRYQTDSGQYRKEKRLEDGTVIGTYAWIDDNGFLRQRDYIADNAGYRILRTKNVFVGRNVPVGEAVKAIKKYPAEAGTLVHQGPKRPVISDLPVNTKYFSSAVPTTTYLPPVVSTTQTYLPANVESTTASPVSSYKPEESPYLQTNYLPSTVPSTTSSPIFSSSPYDVEISPNSVPSSTPSITSSPSPSYVEITQNSIQSSSESIVSTTAVPPYLLPNNTVADINDNFYQSTPSPLIASPANVQYIPQTDSPVYNVQNPNSLDYNPYVRQVDNSYVFNNGPTYPIDRNGQTYQGRIGNGYDPQYPTYDGVSVTNDGFRYYIPRAYHEEQTENDKRTGSFGYIDPFGIRRVIYYNTAPGTGFQHRKNNRYVGFDATPYDPRPY